MCPEISPGFPKDFGAEFISHLNPSGDGRSPRWAGGSARNPVHHPGIEPRNFGGSREGPRGGWTPPHNYYTSSRGGPRMAAVAGGWMTQRTKLFTYFMIFFIYYFVFCFSGVLLILFYFLIFFSPTARVRLLAIQVPEALGALERKLPGRNFRTRSRAGTLPRRGGPRGGPPGPGGGPGGPRGGPGGVIF